MAIKNSFDGAMARGLVRFIQDQLAAWERPVLTNYELGVLLAAGAAELDISLSGKLYLSIVENLIAFGLLSEHDDFERSTVYSLFGHGQPMPMEVACAVDPFAYVSHLSAMEYHGITGRFSKLLYLSTPPDKEWKAHAAATLDRNLGERKEIYLAAGLPQLRYQKFEKIGGMRVELMRRSQRGAFKVIKSPAIRVSMVGRTFLDMVREPEYCGGMQHVVDTYREYASTYLKLIVDEVERHGSSIDKARAGYLLDEVCGLKSPVIDTWAAGVQRGGSRKLDPQQEYAPFYSEKWMLSLNVPSLADE